MSTGSPGAAHDPDTLLIEAWVRLRKLLGEQWTVSSSRPGPAKGRDADWEITGPDGSQALLVVQAKDSALAAREALSTASQLIGTAADVDGVGVVVAPYLSARTREVLQAQGLGYMDATGNVSLRLPQPAVMIYTEGARQNPDPPPGPHRGMSGPRTATLVRELVDSRPPRRGRELATSTGLSEGYVSRLLELFADQALIRRRRGLVADVDWEGLLRARATTTDVIKANQVVPVITRYGIAGTLERMGSLEPIPDPSAIEASAAPPVLGTGTFAANHFAPIAVGGAPMFYVPTHPRAVDEVCRQLGMLRVDQQTSAEILLLRPMNDVPRRRPHPERVEGVPIAGLSQVALDCLSGPGRSPAAGEELLAWMRDHEQDWRQPSPLDH